jgi:hypothetical protein
MANGGIRSGDVADIGSNRLDCADDVTLGNIAIVEECGGDLVHDCE